MSGRRQEEAADSHRPAAEESVSPPEHRSPGGRPARGHSRWRSCSWAARRRCARCSSRRVHSPDCAGKGCPPACTGSRCSCCLRRSHPSESTEGGSSTSRKCRTRPKGNRMPASTECRPCLNNRRRRPGRAEHRKLQRRVGPKTAGRARDEYVLPSIAAESGNHLSATVRRASTSVSRSGRRGFEFTPQRRLARASFAQVCEAPARVRSRRAPRRRVMRFRR